MRSAHLLFLLVGLWGYGDVLSFKMTTTVALPRRQYMRLHSEQDTTDMRGIKGMKGYYRRPSRAIEKGGGFYVPGLEGERIRIITAGALVLMFVANRAGQTVATLPQVVSELTGIAVALLLFAQGAADVFGGGGGGEADSQQQEQSLAALSYLSVLQNSYGADGRAGQGPAVEAIARSLVQTSEDAVYIAALSRDDGRVLFELGPVQGSAMTPLQGRALVDATQISSSSSSSASPSGLSMMALDALQGRAQQPLTCLPPSTKSVGVAAAGDLVWILACAAPVEAIAPDTRSWIQSLLSAPL